MAVDGQIYSTLYPIAGDTSRPIAYVIAASPSPTSVISVPLLSHERPGTTTFDAPKIKASLNLILADRGHRLHFLPPSQPSVSLPR
jgi:hypothetical protein